MGQARAAREAGSQIFQITLPVRSTEKTFWGFGGDPAMYGSSMGTKTREAQRGGLLDVIESEGWRLEHVGYVFQPRQSQSRDRFLASGGVETITGEIVGIYLFRAVERAPDP